MSSLKEEKDLAIEKTRKQQSEFIEMMTKYFAALPEYIEGYKLSSGGRIVYPKQFVASHIAYIDTHWGAPVGRPYLRRLMEYKTANEKFYPFDKIVKDDKDTDKTSAEKSEEIPN